MKFDYGDRVKLVRLGENCPYNEFEGTVTGCSFDDPIASAYIVDLDAMVVQNSGRWKSVSITEHCLERI